MKKIEVLLGLASASLWGYVALGPAGLLAGPAGTGLPDPQEEINSIGSAIAVIDEASWRHALEETGLPELPNPSGIEHEPVRRLVEASRRYASSGDGEHLGQMGEIALALELHEAALELFAAARELGSRVERWTYFLGVEAQTLGRREQALAILTEARELDGSYGPTHARIGSLHLDAREVDLADESYARASDLMHGPVRSIALLGRARVALERDDPTTALAFLDESISLAPRDYLAHRLRSQALVSLERADEAAAAARISQELPLYRGWLTFDPRLQEATKAASTQRSLENALKVAVGSNDLMAARKVAAELVERLPRSPQTLSVYAQLLANTGELARALPIARRALDLDPGNLGRLSTLGSIAVAVKDLELARECAQEAQEVAPADPLASELRGRIAFLEGNIELSIEELREATRLDLKSSSRHYMLIEVLMSAERSEQAEFELERLLLAHPLEQRAREMLATIRAR